MALRWNAVEDQDIFDLTVKMYRDPFVANATQVSPFTGLELDHYAYRFLGSEIYMYKILDTNFERYMEERGDMSRIDEVLIPTQEDTVTTVF